MIKKINHSRKRLTALILAMSLVFTLIPGFTVSASTFDTDSEFMSVGIACAHTSTTTTSSGRTWGGSTQHPLYDSAGNIVATCHVGIYYSTMTTKCNSCGITLNTYVATDYEHSICR